MTDLFERCLDVISDNIPEISKTSKASKEVKTAYKKMQEVYDDVVDAKEKAVEKQDIYKAIEMVLKASSDKLECDVAPQVVCNSLTELVQALLEYISN